MAAKKFGVHKKSFEEGVFEAYIGNWQLLEGFLYRLVSDLENDPNIHYVRIKREENTIMIGYNHEALTDKDCIDRWIAIFQKYNNEDSRSEEHTSELQSRGQLVCCRLL